MGTNSLTIRHDLELDAVFMQQGYTGSFKEAGMRALPNAEIKQKVSPMLHSTVLLQPNLLAQAWNPTDIQTCD